MRDLIKLRNEMSHFLLNSNIDIECVNLPEPIDHLNACKRCPYLTVCATYSRLVFLTLRVHLADEEHRFFSTFSFRPTYFFVSKFWIFLRIILFIMD